MFLESIRLLQFRNYPELEHAFSPGVNIFLGANGSGKTNLLEAVYYLSYFQSFRTRRTEALSYDQKRHFFLEGKFRDGEESQVIRYLHKIDHRTIVFNGESVKQHFKIQGRLKLMLFTVRDLDLAIAGPSGRRDFFDQVLILMKGEYRELLKNYEKLLRLRNQQLKRQLWPKKQDALLATVGYRIVYARNSFLKAILPLFQSIFSQFVEKEFPVEICYRLGSNEKAPPLRGEEWKQGEEFFLKELWKKKEVDLRTGYTHFGPHQDDYIFCIRDLLLQQNASQGEMRLFVYTFKLAIYEYFKKVIKKTPILLLDDIFSDFDEVRLQKFLRYLSRQEQNLIACANPNLILPYFSKHTQDLSLHKIDRGTILPYSK